MVGRDDIKHFADCGDGLLINLLLSSSALLFWRSPAHSDDASSPVYLGLEIHGVVDGDEFIGSVRLALLPFGRRLVT